MICSSTIHIYSVLLLELDGSSLLELLDIRIVVNLSTNRELIILGMFLLQLIDIVVVVVLAVVD